MKIQNIPVPKNNYIAFFVNGEKHPESDNMIDKLNRIFAMTVIDDEEKLIRGQQVINKWHYYLTYKPGRTWPKVIINSPDGIWDIEDSLTIISSNIETETLDNPVVIEQIPENFTGLVKVVKNISPVNKEEELYVSDLSDIVQMPVNLTVVPKSYLNTAFVMNGKVMRHSDFIIQRLNELTREFYKDELGNKLQEIINDWYGSFDTPELRNKIPLVSVGEKGWEVTPCLMVNHYTTLIGENIYAYDINHERTTEHIREDFNGILLITYYDIDPTETHVMSPTDSYIKRSNKISNNCKTNDRVKLKNCASGNNDNEDIDNKENNHDIEAEQLNLKNWVSTINGERVIVNKDFDIKGVHVKRTSPSDEWLRGALHIPASIKENGHEAYFSNIWTTPPTPLQKEFLVAMSRDDMKDKIEWLKGNLISVFTRLMKDVIDASLEYLKSLPQNEQLKFFEELLSEGYLSERQVLNFLYVISEAKESDIKPLLSKEDKANVSSEIRNIRNLRFASEQRFRTGDDAVAMSIIEAQILQHNESLGKELISDRLQNSVVRQITMDETLSGLPEKCRIAFKRNLLPEVGEFSVKEFVNKPINFSENLNSAFNSSQLYYADRQLKDALTAINAVQTSEGDNTEIIMELHTPDGKKGLFKVTNLRLDRDPLENVNGKTPCGDTVVQDICISFSSQEPTHIFDSDINATVNSLAQGDLHKEKQSVFEVRLPSGEFGPIDMIDTANEALDNLVQQELHKQTEQPLQEPESQPESQQFYNGVRGANPRFTNFNPIPLVRMIVEYPDNKVSSEEAHYLGENKVVDPDETSS